MIKINEFPTRLERERIATLGKYCKLEENDCFLTLGLHEKIKKQYKKVEDIVYLAHAIPARVSEFYADFVRGDVDRLTIESKKEDSKEEDEFIDEVVYENDLKETIFDYAYEQSKSGFAVLLGRVDEEDKYKIDLIPSDQYFPQPDGSVVFATYKYNPDDSFHKSMILYVQVYKLESGKVLIERGAFETNQHGVASGQYPLSKVAPLIGLTEIKETETIDIDELPIRQIDNGKRTKYGFGKSDYANIIPNLAEVNERSTHISTQLLKNLDAKITLPVSMFNEDGKVKAEIVEAIAIDKNDQVPQYITSNNPLIDAAERQIMNELKVISFVTGVPMFELLKSAMPDRVESLRIQMFAAIRKTQGKRSKIKRALLDMFRIGGKMKGITTLVEDDITISFEDVLPTDDLTQTQIEVEKVNAGLTSKKSAMQRLENYSDDEADAELQTIQDEDRIAGLPVKVNNPPQL